MVEALACSLVKSHASNTQGHIITPVSSCTWAGCDFSSAHAGRLELHQQTHLHHLESHNSGSRICGWCSICRHVICTHEGCTYLCADPHALAQHAMTHSRGWVVGGGATERGDGRTGKVGRPDEQTRAHRTKSTEAEIANAEGEAGCNVLPVPAACKELAVSQTPPPGTLSQSPVLPGSARHPGALMHAATRTIESRAGDRSVGETFSISSGETGITSPTPLAMDSSLPHTPLVATISAPVADDARPWSAAGDTQPDLPYVAQRHPVPPHRRFFE
jgi:hypothetical protein